MKNIMLLTLLLIIALVFSSWSSAKENPINKVLWLIGTWENATPDEVIYETWAKQSDTSIAGMSYILEQGDTVVFETIRIVQEQNQLYYIPTVKYENDGQAVRFKSTEVNESNMVFENPKHDFPQMISYTKINPDSLLAEISGSSNGQIRKIPFPMKRVK